MLDLRNQHVHPFAGMDLASLLAARTEERGDHPFLIWEPFEGERLSLSYRQFRDRARRVAAGLAKRGIKRGDFLLVHLDNCAEAMLTFFACAEIGAVAVTTNARSSGEEIAYFAENAAVVAAITEPRFADLVAAHARNIKWLAVTPADSGLAPRAGAVSKGDAFASLDGDAANLPRRAPDPATPLSVQFTSGTTSRPKGVLITHANALWGGRVNAQLQTLTQADVHLTYMPLFHMNAQCYSVWATLWAGGTVVLMPRFSTSRFWNVANRNRCTWNSTIPFCLKALSEREIPQHHFRLWGTAVSEPPSDKLFRVKTIGWWGMTETITPAIVGDALHPNRPGAIGRPTTHQQVTVVRDDGTPVGPGETGNLLFRGIRGLSMFQEYLNNPKATAESFDELGWFKTGDRVTVFEDGVIAFADRAKDMLKVGGENVAASEIEEVVRTMPYCREVAVVARKDRMLDEVPVLFVLVDGGTAKAPPDLAERILAQCRKSLADFKVPREVRLVDELPRSTLEKIAKNVLRAHLAEESGSAGRGP
ncbi:MAG TPA: AMP-binding protein [Candidatus Cybelea sp.]|nr:AMP-binding protein [Candidatus Cybelea sp.]